MRAKAEIEIEDWQLIQVSDSNVFIKIGNEFLRFEITGQMFHNRSGYYKKTTVFELSGAEEMPLADFLQNIDPAASSAVAEYHKKAGKEINGTCPFCHCGPATTMNNNLEIIKHSYGFQIECSNCGARGPTSSTLKNAVELFNMEEN